MTGGINLTDGSKFSVKAVVDRNKSLFEIDADLLDSVQTTIQTEGAIEDAWCEMCPVQELGALGM